MLRALFLHWENISENLILILYHILNFTAECLKRCRAVMRNCSLISDLKTAHSCNLKQKTLMSQCTSVYADLPQLKNSATFCCVHSGSFSVQGNGICVASRSRYIASVQMGMAFRYRYSEKIISAVKHEKLINADVQKVFDDFEHSIRTVSDDLRYRLRPTVIFCGHNAAFDKGTCNYINSIAAHIPEYDFLFISEAPYVTGMFSEKDTNRLQNASLCSYVQQFPHWHRYADGQGA